MRKILISQEVWEVIALHGKFGETENDVLERLLHIVKTTPQSLPIKKEITILPKPTNHKQSPNHPFATIKMSAYVQGKVLHV